MFNMLQLKINNYINLLIILLIYLLFYNKMLQTKIMLSCFEFIMKTLQR